MSLKIEHHDSRRIVYSDLKINENPKLREILISEKLQELIKKTPSNTIIVLGGDGTLLETIHQFYMEDVVFLGINYGTKGFLMNGVAILESENQFSITSYPLLECRVDDRVFVAFNEFDIKAGDGKMLHVDIKLLPDHDIVIVGDGIVISTPAGSTGYNASLGGPILPHNIPAYIVTPKAAWKPRGLSPVIISDQDIIEICPIGRKTPVEVYADGQRIFHEFVNSIPMILSQRSSAVHLLVPSNDTDHWKKKVLLEQGFIQT